MQVCNLIYVFDTDSFKWKKYKNVLSDPSAPRTKKSGPDRTLVDSPKLPGGDVTGQVPMARDGHSACVIDDSMYIYGGYVESAHQVSRAHMFLRQISTIKSHDRGKRGYFGNHKVISHHLQLTSNYPFTFLMT